MSKINNNDLMDYLDGTLSAARCQEVESHLRANPDEAELVESMQFSMQALHDLDEAEPMRVSENFWPKVREQLPAQPPRSWLRRTGAQLAAWLSPAPSPWRLSAGIAMVVAFLAMAASMLAPQHDQPIGYTVNSTGLTAEDRAFIQKSMDRHAAYVSSQPLGGAMPAAVGDTRSVDQGDSDDDNEERIP